MGSGGGERSFITGESNEQPIHQVTVREFDMAKAPVTIREYRACVAVGACTRPHKCVQGYDYDLANEDQPVECVSRHQAETFAAWVGGRLPSEAEWEYAARSLGKYHNPWGDDRATCETAVINSGGGGENFAGGCGKLKSAPVCAKPRGNTEQGLCDMIGNVSQWVQDDYHPTYKGAPENGSVWPGGDGYGIKRGGSWEDIATDANATQRISAPLQEGNGGAGIRLVKLSDAEKRIQVQAKRAGQMAREKAKKEAAKKAQVDTASRALANQSKRTWQFKSFSEAAKALGPILWNDGLYYQGASLFLNPMRTKGKVMVSLLKVVQILDQDTILLATPKRAVLEADLPMQTFYARINKNFLGSRDFSDDRCYGVIGEVVGMKQYVTTRGFTKSVPEIFVYAIESAKGVDSQAGCY